MAFKIHYYLLKNGSEIEKDEWVNDSQSLTESDAKQKIRKEYSYEINKMHHTVRFESIEILPTQEDSL